MTRTPAGDVDYDTQGDRYAIRRRPDPRIHAALGDARTVLNVHAGAGSHEPADRYVVAVDPRPGSRPTPHHPRSGAWDQRHGHWGVQAEFVGSPRLVVGRA